MPVDNLKHYIIFYGGNGLPAEKEKQTTVKPSTEACCFLLDTRPGWKKSRPL